MRAEQLVGWNPTTSYPFGAIPGSCVASSEFIYCVGAQVGHNIYNYSTYAPLSGGGIGTWANSTAYPSPISRESCVLSGGYIYCIGGTKSFPPPQFVNSVYYAAISSSGIGAWTATTSYPLPVEGPCASNSGRIFCIGGMTLTPCSGCGGEEEVPVTTVYYANLTSSGVGPWANTTAFPISPISMNCTNCGYPFVGPPASCVASSGYIYCLSQPDSSGGQPGYKAPTTASGVGAWSTIWSPGGTCVTTYGYIYCISISAPVGSSYPVSYASENLTGLGEWMNAPSLPAPSPSSCVTAGGYIYCLSYSGQPSYFSLVSPPPRTGGPSTWRPDSGVRLSGQGVVGVPAAVQLSDGRVRLYYCQQPPEPPTSAPYYVVRSAISSDGLDFNVEAGIRINATGIPGNQRFSVCYPSILRLANGSYRIFYNGMDSSALTPSPGSGTEVWRIYTAVSADGLTFTDQGVAIDPTNPGWPSPGAYAFKPAARLLSDGSIGVYYVNGGGGQQSLESAVSRDGIHFSWEGGVCLPNPGAACPSPDAITDTSTVSLPDWKTMLFGKASMGGSPLSLDASYSSDGINYSSPVMVFSAPTSVNLTTFPQGLADPTLTRLADGSYRLYYDAATGNGQLGIYSATWDPLLPTLTEIENATMSGGTFQVSITHNSSLSGFSFDQKAFSFSFNLVGPIGFHGQATVSFPNELLGGTITVTRNGSSLQFSLNMTADETTLEFRFEQSPNSFFLIAGTTSGSVTKTTYTIITNTNSSFSTVLSKSTSISSSQSSSTTNSGQAGVQGGGSPILTYAIILFALVAGALVVGSLIGFVSIPGLRKKTIRS